MAEYRISGVWFDNEITDYAVHSYNSEGKMMRAVKMGKAKAIVLVENPNNNVKTITWNYRTAGWSEGQQVHVVSTLTGKYLRSDADNKLTDNLRHLIDYDWIKS